VELEERVEVAREARRVVGEAEPHVVLASEPAGVVAELLAKTGA
jgi:hypothetical protein